MIRNVVPNCPPGHLRDRHIVPSLLTDLEKSSAIFWQLNRWSHGMPHSVCEGVLKTSVVTVVTRWG